MGLEIDQVISKIRDEWMAIDGVNVVARGKADGKGCIMVMVTARNPEIEKAIPSEFDGFTVIVKESGIIDAQKSDDNVRSR